MGIILAVFDCYVSKRLLKHINSTANASCYEKSHNVVSYPNLWQQKGYITFHRMIPLQKQCSH